MWSAERGRALGLVYGCAIAVGCGAGAPFELSPGSGGAGGGSGGDGGRPGIAGDFVAAGGQHVGGKLPAGGAAGFGASSVPNAGSDPETGDGGGTPSGNAGTSSSLGGSAGLGDPVDLGGGGHGGSSGDCDDGNACTNDVLLNDGTCQHRPLSCTAANQCARARCEPSTGACVAVPEQDGTACDDANVCTTGDACSGGVCMGTPGAGDANLLQQVMSRIPDGAPKCGGVVQPLNVEFEFPASPATMLEVASIAVDIDFRHYYLAELAIELRHEPSGRSATLYEDRDALGLHADGLYTFRDGAVPAPNVQYQDLPAGAYAPEQAFAAAFDGVTSAGSWTLVFSDRCGEDEGLVRSARLRITAACP